jgi:hypothetical protein
MKNKILPLMMLLCFACFGVAQAQTLNEGFEGTTFPPEDWNAIHVSGSQSWVRSTGTGNNSSSAFALRKDVNGGYEDYLITPKLAPQNGEVLSFYLASQYASNYANTTLTIEVSRTIPEIGAFTTVLATYNSGSDGNFGSSGISDWVNKTVDVSAYVGQKIYIAFHVVDPGYNADVRIDDVTGVSLSVSNCPLPDNVHVVDLTYNSVTVTWDFNEGDMDQHFLQTSAFFTPSYLPWSYPWQAYTMTWDDLDPDTDYTIGVRRYCSEDDQSEPVIMTIHTPRACNLVSDLRVTSLSHTSVTISWYAPESNCNNRLEYKKSSDSEWIVFDDIGCGMGIGPGLYPNTSYDVRVLQHCPNGYQSDWEQISFTTLPAPMTVPYSESFDATSIPDHWARYIGLLNDVMAGTASLSSVTSIWNFGTYNGAFDNSNHAYINIYGTSRKHWLVTPQVAMENNCQLSFELALTKYNGTMQPIDPTLQPDDRFVVLASTDNGTTWTILREWNNTGSPYVYNNILATGEDVVIDLSAYQGTNLTIAFYGESTVGNNGDNDLHIDNVSIDYIPACQKPSNFHASSIAERSVVLSWDAPEGQNHWEVGYKTDDDPYYIYFPQPTENPYLLSGLQPETHYTVKVRALCDGFSETSEWSKEIDFTTLEACPVPTNLHITHVTPHGVTAYFEPGSPTQTLWQYNFTTTDTPPTFANGSTTFVNHFVYYPEEWHMFEPETHYYLWVGIRCAEDNDALYWGEPAEFTTPAACPTPTDVTVISTTEHGFWASFTPGGDWQTQWDFAVTTENSEPTGPQSNTTDPEGFGWDNHPNILGGTTYYLWVGIYCEDDETYHWGEPAEFTTPYACSTNVDTQDVEIEDVQPHEVSLDWSGSPATAEQWQVCYSYYDMIPPESSMSNFAVIVNEPYATIDGLVSDLDYHFWIRALCDVWYGTPEWGEWSNMITVHTEVSCYPPTNVTVSNITSTTATISWDPNPSTSIPVEYYEVNIESDDWGDPYVTNVTQPYLELDLDGWVDGGEDLLCSVYVHAYCGQEEGLSAASEIVRFMLTDKEQLTVNDGTATNEYVPIYGYYCDQYSKSQFIIPAEDIEDMRYSEISWMTFYATNDYVDWGDAEFEVFMMELPCETEFASATLYDWNDMDLVRSEGSLSIRNGLMVVDLVEPFFYTDGNLLIGFKQTIDGTFKHSYWYGVNTTGNTALGGYEYSKSVEFQQFLPKTSFVYEPTGSACIKPTNFTVGRINATKIECAWTPGSDDQTQWEIAWGGEDFDPDDNTTWISHAFTQYNPCWIDDFTPDMTYIFAIRAVCNQSQGVYSNWTCPLSFTLETCPAPTDITFDVSATDATINWEGVGNTWITLYRCNYEMSCGFETQTLEGWTSEGDATWTVGVGDYYTTPGTHSGNYNAKITHTADNNETWLISPMMDLTDVDIAYLDFWYINRAWSGDIDELSVYFRIGGGEWRRFLTLDEAHDTWTSQRVNLALLANNNNCQIGFKMTDHYGYGVGIDDIQIRGYEFAGGYWVYAPDQSITFSDLNPNTSYTLDMVASCDGESGGATDWMYFTTLPAAIFIADGNWNDDSNWSAGEVPEDGTVIIRADAVIPDGYVAMADQIELDGGSITIADGGQLRASSDVEVTVEKNITGYGSGNGNYYLISNPLWEDVYATDVEGLIPSNAVDYDLYFFNPWGSNNGEGDAFAYREWRNYKAEPFLLEYGYGYLYANKEGGTLRFTGNATRNNFSGMSWALQYDEDTEAPFGNWLLAGNFFTCNCYLVYAESNSSHHLEANFYVMNETGDDLQLSETEAALGLCEGAFIELPSAGRLLYMTYDPGFAKSGILNITLTEGKGEVDQARIRFGQGNNLGKLSLREKSTISIPRNDRDFAVVYADNTNEMPVNFKAKSDGTFTLSFSSEDVNFSYLHLIDNLTGEDIDLLDTSTGSVSEYTFEARTTDNPNRFKVVFVTAE